MSNYAKSIVMTKTLKGEKVLIDLTGITEIFNNDNYITLLFSSNKYLEIDANLSSFLSEVSEEFELRKLVRKKGILN